ncbi:forkhead transcription factor M [Apostichopus japonicus]|uniref:Forkhead transcription factor M n=1 Tax=Stichopus japonicus TaxID=307972 RepID=A0A2G8K6K7_STIJA|nr:forkhead transcription factor M [Apostichopus japonicus]
MALDLQCSQDLYGEVGRIDLSHAIETLLGNDDKENDLSMHLLTSSTVSSRHSLESSSCNETPHLLDKTAARQHCRRLENIDTTPIKKQEPRRHLNSVNILCRSKKRKLEDKVRFSESGKKLSSNGSKSGRLTASVASRFGPLQTLHDSNVQIIDSDGSTNAAIMVKDSSGKLHPAEFVPVMVEERNGGFFMSQNNSSLNNDKDVLNYQENRGTGQDDSLTNITWLKRMSAPGVDSVEPCQIQFPDPECERPPYSYSALIQFALISTPIGKMTLKEIYEWIQSKFPFFKTAKLGWKNSIRHNLSLHKIFIREPPDGPGKPAFWTLRPGTVVRLPENRLFVMENKHGSKNGGSAAENFPLQHSMDAKACIKQADGTTQVVSEKILQGRQFLFTAHYILGNPVFDN